MTTPTQSPSSDTRLTERELKDSLTLFEFVPGKRASIKVLAELLPNIETALFFGQVYHLTEVKLRELVLTLFKTPFFTALLGSAEQHSTSLQSYVLPMLTKEEAEQYRNHLSATVRPADGFAAPDSELLVAAWEAQLTEVAESIETVANKVAGVLDLLPSKYGTMTMQHLRQLNTQRGSIGKYAAQITHDRNIDRLVILDVSGSMSERTVRAIVGDVVALAYKANATLAVVSNHTYYWNPGEYSVDSVLSVAEFGGTQYETLIPLLQQDWEKVITIADYDSSGSAKEAILNTASGHIGEVLDMSLVDRPTFLAECVGQLAQSVRPFLIGTSRRMLR